eukprot:477071-Alexandrium_andersonii.AAC.1
MFEALSRHAPMLLRPAAAWYGGARRHEWIDAEGTRHVFDTTGGVDQGCPLASACYAIALRAQVDATMPRIRALDPGARIA